MKKFLWLFCISTILTSSATYCAELDSIDELDEWNNIGKMQDAWNGQQIITDDQFDKVIEQKTKYSKEKAERKFKKKMGEALIKGEQPEVNVGTLKEIAQDYPTLLVPTNLRYGETQISPGFYRIISAKNKENKYTINFYQGNKLIGKIPAQETQNDFDAETINFAKIIYSNNDKKAQFVYGCLEYNLVAYAEAN